ncbi:hypothetical protein [Chryseobacterium sp. JK1]|uniref:hypothetical protein n=1 Tax=Chryseobacterium sp. JK1 TaxID=874294 RepID=UPI003D69863C
MKYSVFLIALLFSVFLSAQNQSDKADKIIDEMCADFKQNEKLGDSLRIERLNEKFILPYVNQFSGSERQSKIDYLNVRFQNRCEYFREFLQKTDPPQSDNWVRLNTRPNITVSEK